MASEYLKWKYRDVQPDKPVELTKKQRRQNWWHYHKWYVAIAVVAAAAAIQFLWHPLSQVHPDYQIAYVGTYPLSEEEAAAWENRLSALGTDCNGDGKIVVQLNRYPTGDDPMYAVASNVKLMADLDACESYFFLLEDPEAFQTSYDILQEDYFPIEDGLFLARREFWEDRTGVYMEESGTLWDVLCKEAMP